MFAEILWAQLTVTAGSTALAIPAGDIESFRVQLHSWGFEAEVTFTTWPERGEDTLFPSLGDHTLVKAELALQPVHDLPTSGAPDPLAVKGIVTTSEVVERTVDASGRPIRWRRVTLRFADAAQVLWRQHFPTVIAEDTSMADLIGQQAVEGITVAIAWPTFEVAKPIVCLGLGDDLHGASFYDFLCWYVDRADGVLAWDASLNKYALAPAKVATGTPSKLAADEVAFVEVLATDRARHDVRVLNGYSEATTALTTVANDDGVTGLHRDVLAVLPIASDQDGLAAREKGRLAARSPEPTLLLELGRFPTVELRPGLLVDLAKSGGWSAREGPARGARPSRRSSSSSVGSRPSSSGPGSSSTWRSPAAGARARTRRAGRGASSACRSKESRRRATPRPRSARRSSASPST